MTDARSISHEHQVYFFCARSGDGVGVGGTFRAVADALVGTAPTQNACSGAGSTVQEPRPPRLRESGSTKRCTRNCTNKGLGRRLGPNLGRLGARIMRASAPHLRE